MGMRPNEDVAWLLQRLNAGEEGERGRLMEAWSKPPGMSGDSAGTAGAEDGPARLDSRLGSRGFTSRLAWIHDSARFDSSDLRRRGTRKETGGVWWSGRIGLIGRKILIWCE